MINLSFFEIFGKIVSPTIGLYYLYLDHNWYILMSNKGVVHVCVYVHVHDIILQK